MQHPVRHLCLPSGLLAAIAFSAIWLMTSKFDDDSARLVFAAVFASWVAVNSGITGFLLLQVDEQSDGELR
jgi:hypothetical protein